MSIKYNHELTEDIFRTNALVGIPKEVTALGIARKHQKEAEWNTKLAELAKQTGFRKNGKSLQALLEEVCTQMPERDLVLYSGTPQVHDYDEKHLLVEGISSVDADGRVVESYDQLLVMKDVFRDGNGKIKFFTPYQAVRHCEQEGHFLPPTNLTIPLLAALFPHRNRPEVNKVMMQYKDKGNGNGWHAQNTIIDNKAQKMIHYPYDTDFPKYGGTSNINAFHSRTELPFKKTQGIWPFNKKLQNITLEDGLKDSVTAKFVKQFSGLEDPSILVEVSKYFGKTSHVWISSSNGTRAAWFGCGSYDLDLCGDGDLGDYGAARGVRRIESAEAFREERHERSDLSDAREK